MKEDIKLNPHLDVSNEKVKAPGLPQETSEWIDRMVAGLKRAEVDEEYRERLGRRVS